jgi:hypothetical protein
VNVDAKILSRLDELIESGKRLLATRKEPAPGFLTGDFVDVQLANQWFTSCLNLLSRSFGVESEHYQRIKALFKEYPKWAESQQAYGVILAARDDYASGSLFDLKLLIEAEVFDDLLEQADHLFAAGYFQPAAVVAGSVLEDGLRKLCVAANIVLPERPKLDWMNAELVKSGKYSKLVQKRITTIADLRNSAAHGKLEDFGASDVEAMLRDVRDFMAKHYS